jgi:cold shock CspA family protein/tetratricopeptide (TPR) repeat protein
VARKVAEEHSDDIYVRREVVWALYDAKFKPARERGDLNALLRAGQQMMELTDEDLPVRRVVLDISKLAKDKMRWDIASTWCDRIDQQKLSTEPREMDGHRAVSEREQWYFAKVKSLVELKRWDEARGLALEALQAFPRKRDFARWAAQALAGQGCIPEAIAELETLAQTGRPEWYLLKDLAELKKQNGQFEEAYHIACQAALAFGEDKAKVSLFVLIGQVALELQQFDVAARHAALSRLVRVREGWSVSREVGHLESEARAAYEQATASPLDLPDEIPALAALCRQDWERAVPPELRPQRREKRAPRPRPETDGVLHTGRIKMYNAEKGFGFITADDGTGDIFFHISSVQDIESPAPGIAVQYEVGEGRKGPAAMNVQAVPIER